MNPVRFALLAVTALLTSNAFAVEYAMTCEDVVKKLNREATTGAKARFADLSGSCLGVVDRDGELFMHTEVVIRRVNGNRLTLYVPATDRTFDVDTDPRVRLRIGNERVRARDLNRGQQLSIFVSVEEFTQPVIDEMAFETEVEDELIVAPAVIAAALPTTG